MIQKYVLCYIETGFGIICIHKKRPDWQAGKITLPGGHVEDGETWEEASVREIKEETDLDASHNLLRGIIWHSGKCQVYVTQHTARGIPKSMTDEVVQPYSFDYLMGSNMMLPNMYVLLPLVRYNVGPFLIQHFDSHQVFKVNTCINLSEFP